MHSFLDMNLPLSKKMENLTFLQENVKNNSSDFLDENSAVLCEIFSLLTICLRNNKDF